MDPELLAPHVDAIYGVARDEFTAERDRRAKQLRADGHNDESAALRAHRKPTVTAWVVNQVVRSHPNEVAELIGAGDQLRDAQRRAASGRGSDGLREATQRVRQLVANLRAQGRELLASSGARPDAHLDDVGGTLFTAAIDPAHRERLHRGLFEKAVAGAGFGGIEGLTLVAGTGTSGTAADASRIAQVAQPEQDEEEERRNEQQRRTAARKRAEQRMTSLMRSRDRQRGRMERAEARAAELRARLADASDEAEAQRAALEQIDQELADLRDELDGLDG